MDRRTRDKRREWQQVLTQKQCTLCKCISVAEKFGFFVCEYHCDHGENSPLCPFCVSKN